MVIDAHLHLWNTERLHDEWLQRPENAAINRTFGGGASGAAEPLVHSRDRAIPAQPSLHTT